MSNFVGTYELYEYMTSKYDLNNDTFIIHTITFPEFCFVCITRMLFDYRGMSLEIVSKLGDIDNSKMESADKQFDAGVIKHLISKGVKFDFKYSIEAAIRIEHRELARFLISQCETELSLYIEHFMKRGIDIRKYIGTSAFSQAVNIADQI